MSFTAKQLEEAIAAAMDGEDNCWLELQVPAPNPLYDAAAEGKYRVAYAESLKLKGDARVAAYKACSAMYDHKIMSKNIWVPIKVTLDGVEYEVKSVEQKGGMDEGTYAHVVIEVDGRTFMKQGSYYSHDGYYWDGDFKEVSRKTKTVEVYE